MTQAFDPSGLLTIYGRKPVLEALQHDVPVIKLHLADSNRRGGIIDQLLSLAEQRDIPIAWHERKALSRISRNGKQDQGVAADLKPRGYQSLSQFLENYTPHDDDRFLALDSITNPQNLGMILRSAAAAGIDGVIIPETGCASLGPLTLKASAGAMFHCPIIRCERIEHGLKAIAERGVALCGLDSNSHTSLLDQTIQQACAFVLGGESEGLSRQSLDLVEKRFCIPMQNGVESLNVAVTSALVCFLTAQPKNHR